MSKSILLSEKHGLNPTIPRCFVCGEDKNEIILAGLKGERIAKEMGHSDGQMPMSGICFDKTPCEKCQGYMKQGIIVISIRAGSDNDNPYRTGGWWVVKEDLFMRMRTIQNNALINNVLKRRVAFMDDQVCEQIGLKKQNKG
jgi:hypothetical protein